SLASGLLGLLDAHGDRWASVQAVLAVAAVGAAAVAAAAVALVAVLAASRRRRSVAVWRGRGASRGQVLGSVAAEGLLLTLPSAATAALLAVALVPGGGVVITLGAAAVVSFLTTVLLVAVTAPATVGPPHEGGAERETGRGPGPRRLVLEGVVVLLAITGAALLRERGVRGAGATGQLGGADPFIAAVPALVAVAAGLVAVRLFPVGTRLLAGLARARRDLVPVLALRRLMRGAGSGTILTVLLATAAVGGFSSATLLHLDGAAEAVAWQETGASFRLTSVDRGQLTGTFDPADLPGVQAVAAAYEGPANVAGQGVQVRLLAIDAAAYERVVGGTPADPQLPVALTVSASSGPDGSSAAPLPALVSQAVADGTAGTAGGSGGGSPLGVGAGFQLVLPGHQSSHSVSFRTVAVRGAFPSLPIGQAFVVIPRAAVLAAMPDLALPATAVYLRAADDAASAMRVVLAHAPPGMVLASRAERTAALTASPMVRTVSDGMALAALLAAAYAALAVTAALALTGAARAVEVAHLRALGLSRRETLGLVVVEHGPTVAFAFVAGAALGLGLFVLLRDGLGLGAVVGSPVSVPLRVEPAHLGIILAAIILIVALGIGLATALERRAPLAASLRRGPE
ncbi:MAG: FtsX-like permease family protein, partial [Candidatus Limnocylindrales bacterium]